MTFADKVNRFNANLPDSLPLTPGVEVMNPFHDPNVRLLSEGFYQKYYADNDRRKIILGINPGRLGAGLTGIPFTDPLKLDQQCQIPNSLNKATEPSAGFIYDMIDAFGGVQAFYSKYFINSVSPLGFVRDGKNYNYYDSKELEAKLKPFIIKSLKALVDIGIQTEKCYCLGNGKNFNYLQRLNNTHHFFKTVIPLPHPRWVVQYRRKQYQHFIDVYIDALGE